MFDAIIAVLFIAIPAIVLIVAALIGLKRNIYQSVAKLLMTILSIVICAVLVKAVTPLSISSVINTLGLAEQDILQYLFNSSISGDILRFASAIVLPVVFFAVYLIISFVFLLLYLIPGRLLSDKAFAKRAATKESLNNEVDNTAASQPAEETVIADNAAGEKKPDWKKIGLKAGSVLCCILSAVLVLSAFALPIGEYSGLATTVASGFGEMDMDSDVGEIIAVVETLDSHPTNRCYSVFNMALSSYFDRFTTDNGLKVTAKESILSIISLTNSINELDTSVMNAKFFYDLADRIGESKFISGLLTRVVHDMCNAWLNHEAFLGAQAPEFDGQIMNILLTKLSDCTDVTSALRAVGDALSLQESMMNNNGSGETVDTITTIEQIFENLDAGSADMIKAFVSEEVLTDLVAMPPAMAQSVSGFVGNVVEGIVEIKENPELSDDEKTKILNQEAAAMAEIIDMTQNPESVNAESLIGAVVDSTVISGTIQKVTENGAIQDPYGISEAISSEFKESVATELKNQGVEESGELYSSIMALFG